MLDVMLLKRGAITGTLFRNVNVISKGRVDGMRGQDLVDTGYIFI